MNNEKYTILITGASSGIGRETAIRLAKEGHKVFAGVRRKVDKEEVEKLSENIIGVYIDVANSASIEKAFFFVLKHANKLDVLINNAGIAVAGPVEFVDVKKIKEQFDVNTFGAIAVVQKFMPLLTNSKIINISSMAASGIFPFVAPYCASKRALDILFNSFALENKDNIRVISVKPSSIKTPIWNKSVKKAREYFENISENNREKYSKELLKIEEQALKNNEKAIEIYVVVDTIIKIINMKNPKPSYNVGKQAVVADWMSKLPVALSNKIIKFFLNRSI